MEENTSETTSSRQKPLTNELLYNMAVNRMGEAALVRSATVTGEGQNKVVHFEVIRPAVCHDGAIVGNVAAFSQKTMSSLFKYPEVSRVRVTMYGTTQDSASNNEKAVVVAIDRPAAQNMDWFALSDVNLQSFASEFFIDPRILANWQVEGGGSTPRSQQGQQTTSTAAT